MGYMQIVYLSFTPVGHDIGTISTNGEDEIRRAEACIIKLQVQIV